MSCLEMCYNDEELMTCQQTAIAYHMPKSRLVEIGYVATSVNPEDVMTI